MHRQHRESDAAESHAIKQLFQEADSATGEEAFHVADVYVEACEASVFNAAARGMVTPLMETMFFDIFAVLKKRRDDPDVARNPRPACPQAPWPDPGSKRRWDPHFFYEAIRHDKETIKRLATEREIPVGELLEDMLAVYQRSRYTP